MNRLTGLAVLAALAMTAAARSEPYWIAWEAASGHFPEEEGWTRHTFYGGGQRWFEDGALVLDTTAYGGICDWAQMDRPGAMDPGPGEIFAMKWRLNVAEINPPDQYEADVGFASDEAWCIGFNFGLDFVHSVFENRLIATFPPYVFHDFELISSDMRNYTLLIDGWPKGEGVFLHLINPSQIFGGDGVQGPTSMTRWEWFEFGAVASPQPGDTNCDGAVDFRDINPFVLALTNGSAYQQTYPNCWPENADVNGNGSVGFDDINPFAALLTAQ
jgi:hypothetical protein